MKKDNTPPTLQVSNHLLYGFVATLDNKTVMAKVPSYPTETTATNVAKALLHKLSRQNPQLLSPSHVHLVKIEVIPNQSQLS